MRLFRKCVSFALVGVVGLLVLGTAVSLLRNRQGLAALQVVLLNHLVKILICAAARERGETGKADEYGHGAMSSR